MTGVLAESVLLLDRAGSTDVLLRILFQGPGGSGPSPDPAHPHARYLLGGVEVPVTNPKVL